MATCSSILALKIPWTEQPGGLQSMGWQTVGHDWAQHSSGTFKVCSQILKTIQFNSYSIWSPYIWLANDNLVAFNWIKFNGRVHYYGNFHILWTPYNPLAQRPHMASWVSFTAEQTSWFPCSLEQIFSLSFPFFHGIFMLFMCESSFSALGLFTFWVEQFFVIRERITAFLVSTSRCQQQPLLMRACSVVSDSLWFPGRQPSRLLCPWDFSGKNTGMVCHFLLQGLFPTKGLNLCLSPMSPALQTDSLLLSHWGSLNPSLFVIIISVSQLCQMTPRVFELC